MFRGIGRLHAQSGCNMMAARSFWSAPCLTVKAGNANTKSCRAERPMGGISRSPLIVMSRAARIWAHPVRAPQLAERSMLAGQRSG